MSAISLKSITGITSITTPAGVDNQLTLHNNNTTEAVKLDIAGNLHFHNHLNITGVSTASNFKTGTSNLHNTGLNVQDLDVDGHTNLDNVSIAGVTTASGNITIENAEPSLFLTDTNGNPDYKIFNDQGAFKIYDTTYSATRLQIGPSNGEVTIASNTNFPNGITMNPGTASVVNTIAQRLGNTTAKIRFPANDTFTVETAGAEALRIGSNGSVGIGTDYLSGNASVYHKLMVEGDTTSPIAVAKIVRKNSSASNSTYTFEVDSSAHTSNMSSGGAMAVDVYSGRAFTINGNGWVGIGTNNPSQKVSIAKGRVNIDVNNDYYGVWFDGDTQGENHVSVGRWYNTGGGLKSGYSQYGINNLILENNHPTASHSLVIQPKGQKVAIGTHLVDDDHIVNVKGAVVADGFISNGGALSHRNVVINGGMEIAQRGTTSTGNTSGGYKTCDRWELSLNTAGTWTVTRSGTCPDGFNHSIKLDCTTANTSLSATSFLEVRTAFEGQDLRRFAKGTTSAKPITVSFYVKTNKNGTYAV